MFRDKPWLIFCDFNEILDIEEHSGHEDSQFQLNGMRDFQAVAKYCSLLDKGYQGPRLT